MENRGFIINIFVILVVLGIMFFSQSPNFDVFSEIPGISKIGEFVGGAVSRGGEAAKAAIVEQKNILAKNIWQEIKNYFAEKFSKYSGTKVE